MELCAANDIPHEEANLSLAEMYSADEVFITGTMGELVPVIDIDGRKFEFGEMTKKLLSIFREYTKGKGVPIQ